MRDNSNETRPKVALGRDLNDTGTWTGMGRWMGSCSMRRRVEQDRRQGWFMTGWGVHVLKMDELVSSVFGDSLCADRLLGRTCTGHQREFHAAKGCMPHRPISRTGPVFRTIFSRMGFLSHPRHFRLLAISISSLSQGTCSATGPFLLPDVSSVYVPHTYIS